jgi:hypothetical protein
MEFNDETAWPDDIRTWLENHHDLFLSWELQARGANIKIGGRGDHNYAARKGRGRSVF